MYAFIICKRCLKHVNYVLTFSQFHSSIEGQFGAIWDRGSLVAINPGDREKYDELEPYIKILYYFLNAA